MLTATSMVSSVSLPTLLVGWGRSLIAVSSIRGSAAGGCLRSASSTTLTACRWYVQASGVRPGVAGDAACGILGEYEDNNGCLEFSIRAFDVARSRSRHRMLRNKQGLARGRIRIGAQHVLGPGPTGAQRRHRRGEVLLNPGLGVFPDAA